MVSAYGLWLTRKSPGQLYATARGNQAWDPLPISAGMCYQLWERSLTPVGRIYFFNLKKILKEIELGNNKVSQSGLDVIWEHNVSILKFN